MTSALVWPLLAYAAFSVMVLGPLLLYSRVSAVRRGEVNPRYFKELDAKFTVPRNVTLLSRNFSNQFEYPVIFYVICLTIMHLGIEDSTFVALAWGYFATRLAHTAIHVTYNKIVHRLVAFLASTAVLGVMVVRTGLVLAATDT